jgi:hypothetical protein
VAEVSQLLDDPTEYARMAKAPNPFGDGHAAERIVASLLEEPVAPMARLEHEGVPLRTGGSPPVGFLQPAGGLGGAAPPAR